MYPWLLAVYLFYGLPTMLVYFAFVYIILFKYRKEFNGSFYRVYAFSTCINILTYINTTVVVRFRELPFMVPMYLNFRAVYPIYPVHFMLAFTCYFLQNSAFILVHLNRFTAIYFPFHYEKIWDYLLWISAAVVIGHSFALSFQALYVDVEYVLLEDIVATSTKTAIQSQPFYERISVSGIVYVWISIALNVLNISRLIILNKRMATMTKNYRHELNMMFIAIVLFAVQLFGIFGARYISNTLISNFSDVRWMSMLSTAVSSDVLTLFDAYIMLIFNRLIRTKCAHLLLGCCCKKFSLNASVIRVSAIPTSSVTTRRSTMTC